ncbi:MAG: hydrogen peroxide-inducible genes activator [Rhodospirillales bacterium]|nr:hydrogen peroxide-inducible genes activator [Rhodospirillales bacterium]
MILPTFRQLQYLVAVVDLGHFGHAAERCHVTQSTLSAGIRELETALQAELIERTRRSVKPTPLGLEIAEKGRALLDGARDIAEMAQSEMAPLSGRMRLGVIPTIGPFVLPRVLGGLRTAYPDLRLYLREDQTEDALGQLRRGELEAALIALPYDTEDFVTLALGKDPFWVALPAGHTLADRKVIAAEDLPADELLLLEEGHCLRDHALAACNLRSRRHGGAFEGTSLYTLVEMVANGLGITFVPEVALSAGLGDRDDVVFRPLPPAGPMRTLALVWRRSFRREDDIAALATYLLGAMAGLRAKRIMT